MFCLFSPHKETPRRQEPTMCPAHSSFLINICCMNKETHDKNKKKMRGTLVWEAAVESDNKR